MGDWHAANKKRAELDPELFKRYMAFNEEMYRAGVLIASEGLNPGTQGGHALAKNGKGARVVL